MKVTEDMLVRAMRHFESLATRERGTLVPEVSALVAPWMASRDGALEFEALPEHVRTLLAAVPGLLESSAVSSAA